MLGLRQDVLSWVQPEPTTVFLAVFLAIMTTVMTYVRPAIIPGPGWAEMGST